MTTYVYDTTSPGNDSPVDMVKWLRRNFGNRGEGWDFTFSKKRVIIEIWRPELCTMYMMFKQ